MAMKTRHRARMLGAVAAVAALATATACQPTVVVGNVQIRNAANAPRVWDNSDPAVLVVGGKTYLYGSSNNKKVPVREVTSFNGTVDQSRTQWNSGARDAMHVRPEWVNPSKHGGSWQIWAPSVMKIGTRYVMYFSANRGGASNQRDDQCIGMATAGSPTGPFVPFRTPVYCGLKTEPGANSWGRGALDPEPFRAPDGSLYLLVSLSLTKGNIGVIRLNRDGLVVGGTNAPTKILASQSLRYHDGIDNGSIDYGKAFLENPTMHYDAATKTYLLFYSAGQWYTPDYLTGFARCATPEGPCVLDGRGPFLKSGSGRVGAGGMTVFKDPSGTLRVAYATWRAGHAPPAANPDGSYSRQTHWAKLIVSNTADQKTQVIRLAE